MTNRRIEMYEYHQIIYRLQQGQTVRAISRDGLAGRDKIRAIKQIATQQGWLSPGYILPDEKTLSSIFYKSVPSQQESKSAPHAEMIKSWSAQGIEAKVIYQHLKDNYGYIGAYNSIQRFTKKIKEQDIGHLTVPLNFLPGEAAQVDFGSATRGCN